MKASGARLAQQLQERGVHLDVEAAARVQHSDALERHHRVAGRRRARLCVLDHAVVEDLHARAAELT